MNEVTTYRVIFYSMISLVVGLSILCALVAFTGCASAPTTKDYMSQCKLLCRKGVQSYVDDSIECRCRESN